MADVANAQAQESRAVTESLASQIDELTEREQRATGVFIDGKIDQ
jgi:hypothetical protein